MTTPIVLTATVSRSETPTKGQPQLNAMLQLEQTADNRKAFVGEANHVFPIVRLTPEQYAAFRTGERVKITIEPIPEPAAS